MFQRDGADLHCEVPISFVAACLGGEIEIPTLSGKVKLKIPAETQSGKVLRIRGHGIKPLRGGSTGDLMCHISIETPVNLSKDQKKILEDFQSNLDTKQMPKSAQWFEAAKRFFEKASS